jgi:hypothetical protein
MHRALAGPDGSLPVDGRTPLIPASFPGKLVTTFGADMTPIKRAAQPREVHHHACAVPNTILCSTADAARPKARSQGLLARFLYLADGKWCTLLA